MTINPNVRNVIVANGWELNSYDVRHALQLKLFIGNVNEAHDDAAMQAEKEKVINLIRANHWDKNPDDFLKSLKGSKHPNMLTPYSLEELRGMDCYTLPGYNIGFALKDHDGTEEGGSGQKGKVEIVAVHNNSHVGGIGKQLISAAIKNGGQVLDHFDGFLSPLYKGLGFEEYKRDKYDPQYDKAGLFAKRYGKQDVIYRRYKKPEVA